jgi:hypothetical protein
MFAGSNPAKDNFLRSGNKTVVRFYGMLKIPEECDRETSPAKLTNNFRQVSPTSLSVASIDICREKLWWINQD